MRYVAIFQYPSTLWLLHYPNIQILSDFFRFLSLLNAIIPIQYLTLDLSKALSAPAMRVYIDKLPSSSEFGLHAFIRLATRFPSRVYCFEEAFSSKISFEGLAIGGSSGGRELFLMTIHTPN